MPSVSSLAREVYNRIPVSVKRFAVAGGATVVVDAIAYSLFLKIGVPIDIAKASGLVVSTIFAYTVNRNWTFSGSEGSWKSIILFLVLYVFASASNVIVNRLVIDAITSFRFVIPIAWFIATGTSATINYLGMRFIVFPVRKDT